MTDGIRAVILDWAGTMVDHGCRAPVIALQQVFAAAGLPISEAEARADMGRAKRDHIRAILALPRVEAAWREGHGSPPDEDVVGMLHDQVEPMMRAAADECAELIAGAAPLAARLQEEGIAIGSCTGYTRAMMEGILPRAAAQGYAPTVTICSGETAAGRPSPLMLWKALVELGVWPASACVKVDDAPVGIAEGRNGGSWTVGIAASGNGVGLSAPALAALSADDRAEGIAAAARALDAAGADYVIDTVADLWPVLERIAGRIRAGERPRPA